MKAAGREKGLEETDRHNDLLPISQNDCEDKMINWMWHAYKKENILMEVNIY